MKTLERNVFRASLSRKDSNLVKQNQNLLCYHYTTGQSESGNPPYLIHLVAKVIRKRGLTKYFEQDSPKFIQCSATKANTIIQYVK